MSRNRHGGGGAKAVNHHLVIVRCLIDFAVGNERWGKFGRGSDTVVRFGFAVPDGLERAASDDGDIIRAQDIGSGSDVRIGITRETAGRFVSPQDCVRGSIRRQRQNAPWHSARGRGSNRRDSGAVSHGIGGEVSATLGEHVHRVVLALNKQKVVEIDAGAVDMSCAAVRRVPDGKRVGREDLVEIVEKGRVPVEGCVVERGDEGGIE